MALRNTLTEVVEMVRLEALLSSNTSRGLDHRDNLVQLITRHYLTLAEDFDWEHLNLKRDSATARKTMQAGSRYYDFPTALNPLKITRAWVKWGNSYLPVEYGINYGTYNAHDSDTATNRADPVLKWDFYGGTQFEVFPIPASTGAADGYQVAFDGQKTVEQLTGSTSRLDMDGHLIALRVAAEILLGNGKEKLAEVKGQAAKDRFQTLRANLSDKGRYLVGRGSRSVNRPRHPMYIP